MAISFAAGQLVTSAEMNLLCPTLAIKSSAQSVTNSATLVNDNDIVFTFVANQTVHVDAYVSYQGSGTTNAGLRLAWASTGTLVSVMRACLGPADSGSNPPDAMIVQSRPVLPMSTNNLYESGIVANAAFITRESLIITTGASGGTLTLQFAQFTATASQSMTLNVGTFAIARYVA